MYSRITIKNFREIESLEAAGLRRINLIVGRNNSGKTTFLEGVFLLGGATNPLVPTTLGQLRGQRLEDTYPDPLWRPLFHNLDPRIDVEIQGQWAEEQSERKLKIHATQGPRYADSLEASFGGEGGIIAAGQDLVINILLFHYRDPEGNETNTFAVIDPRSRKISEDSRHRADFVPTTLLPARSYASPARVAQQFSSALKIKQDEDVIDALRIIEPNVQQIVVIAESSGPSICLDLGLDALVPLAVCGEGMVRLFSIILELIASRNGVLLIDEIDNGLHHKVMPSLWKLLGALVEKHKVQVFGTTHNDDMVRSALEAFAGTEGTLGLFRIDKRGNRHVMVSYSDEAIKAVLEVPFEVRG